MIKGFTFNGKHSLNDMGIIVKSKNRPILPEPKIVVEELNGVDGDYDYSDVNPDARTKYKSRIMDVDCSFKTKNMSYIRVKAHEVAAWLACGEKQLVFDDETAVVYLARVNNQVDLETQIAKIGRFTIQFKCRPLGLSPVTSNEDINFGDGLMCGYGYRLDMVPTIFNITGAAAALNIYNPGTYVKPLIRVTGSFAWIAFSTNEKSLTYGAPLANEKLDIKCAEFECIKNDTENCMNNLSGDFIEFANGNNALYISGVSLNCTVTLIFNYLYL